MEIGYVLYHNIYLIVKRYLRSLLINGYKFCISSYTQFGPLNLFISVNKTLNMSYSHFIHENRQLRSVCIDWVRRIARIIDIAWSYKKFIKASGARTGGNKVSRRDATLLISRRRADSCRWKIEIVWDKT